MMKAQHKKLFLAVTVLMTFLSGSLLAQDQYGQNGPNGQDQYQGGGDPPDRVARLGYVSGSVSFQPNGEDQWSQALPNYPLTTGDRLYTDRDGRAELETGNIAVRLSSGTDLTTTNLTDQLVQIGLAQGTLRVRAYEVRDGNSIEIDTPNAALTLLRPGSYRVETYPDDYSTLVTVNSGDLQIDGNGFSQVLHGGQSVKLTGADQVQMSWVQPPGNDDFDQWSGDRDRRFLSSNSRQYVGQYTPGYNDLDQYGQWQSTPDYGAVWYPTAVPADWAPYRYGRWAWIEPWGWTWVEDEPWGFAPFHYGRWALVGSRWGWVPGTVTVAAPVYAPALVAFVGGPDANVQVWFPLGPSDPYFPWYHHSDVYLRQVNVTNVRTQVNIVNVINVRNVENVHYAYQRVAPTAVSVDTFRSSRPVARETVRIDNTAIGRARVIPHPEIRPDVRAVNAGTAATHPPVERIRPKVESRPPLVRGGNYQIDQRGNQPAQSNNRPQGNPPPNQPGQFNRYPAQNGSNQPAASGQNNNRPPDARTGPGYTGRPAEADRNTPNNTNQPPANGQNNNRPPDARTGPGYSGRPAEVQRANPPTGQNPNPPAQQGAQNPAPGQNANAGNDRNNPGRGNSGRENENNGPGNNNGSGNNANADNNRGRGPGGPPQNAGNPQSAPAQNQRPLVTKNPPPQQNPSFAQRQNAMQEHPGRPLEPQQMDNLRRGQPAGQMHDRETPEHPNAAPPQRPQPQQQSKPSNPPPQNNNRGKDDKDKDKDKPK